MVLLIVVVSLWGLIAGILVMMKYVGMILLTGLMLGIGLVWPGPVSAHLFGGPPFLSLNGKDALTNPVYMSVPSFVLPQDNAQGVYLVGKPIKLKVALDKLPVPAEIAAKSTFRWHWEEGGSEVSYGATQEHTYTAVGSHLVTLDVLAPGETDYLNLDTVRVQVVPRADYRLPTVSISAIKDEFASGRPVSFVSKSTADPSTTIQQTTWDFGDGTTSKETNPTHVFSQKEFLNFVYVEVVDGNGLKTESGITAIAQKGALHLSPLTATISSIPLIDPVGLSWKKYLPLIIGGVVVLAVVGIMTFGLLRQRNVGRR